MATSTITLLQTVNRILLNINERPLADTTTLMGQKVKDCIETALTDIAEAQDWRFAEEVLASVSWTGNEVTLGTDIQKVEEVFYADSSFGYIPLQYLHRDSFDRYPTSTYTSGRGLFWTDVDYNRVRITPYPTTAPEQAKILFRVLKRITLPQTDSSFFSVPDQFVLLMVRRATELMARRHTEDLALAQAYGDEYRESLQQLKQKNAGRHVKFQNAYRDK